MSTKTGSFSIAKHRRPSFSAAMICVPEPLKGSKQRSPGLVCTRIGIAKTSTGLTVGWPIPVGRFLPS